MKPATTLAAFFFVAGTLLSGCAGARRPATSLPRQEPRFWHGCYATAAKPDGFWHFVCTDVHNKQYEVLVRKKK